MQAVQDYYSYSYADPSMGFSSGTSIILMGVIGVIGWMLDSGFVRVSTALLGRRFPEIRG